MQARFFSEPSWTKYEGSDMTRWIWERTTP